MKNYKINHLGFSIILILLILGSFINKGYSQTKNRYVSIGILNKYEFYVLNNSGFPITFIYEGKKFILPVTIEKNSRFMMGEFTRLFGESPATIIADYIDDELSPLRKIFGVYKFKKNSESLLYENNGNILNKSSDFEVILTDENYNQSLQMIIRSIILNADYNLDEIVEIFKNPEEKLSEEIVTNIPLILHGIEEYQNLETLRNSNFFSSNLFSFSKPKNFKSITPRASLELGIHGNESFIEYWYGFKGSIKLTISPFSEKVWSKEKLRAHRIYFTGFYEGSFHGIDTYSKMYVGPNILSGTSQKEELEKNTNILLNNKTMGLGLRFRTNFNPSFFSLVEGGIIKKINDYSLNTTDSKFVNPNVKFKNNKFHNIIVADKDVYPYINLGIGYGSHVRGYYSNRVTGRRTSLIFNVYAAQPGNYIFQDSFQFYDSEDLLLPMKQNNSLNMKITFSINLGFFI